MKNGTCQIQQLLKEFNFEILNLDEKDLNKSISHAELTRPGLELVGYYDYTDIRRPVIMGLKEIKYFEVMTVAERHQAFEFLTQPSIPYILIARDLECPSDLLQMCRTKHFPLFRSPKVTCNLINEIVTFTNEQLAPQELCHGTLLEIFGLGVLLVGKSGIGKSESALELIKKGHRLVADDSIITYQMYGHLYGKAPEHLRNLLEVRGIGVIDVSKVFGITSISESKTIDYVVELVSQEEIQKEARLSTQQSYYKIMETPIKSIKIPVAAGRMVADLIEVGITNMRLKSKGFDATQDLIDTFDRMTMKVDDKK